MVLMVLIAQRTHEVPRERSMMLKGKADPMGGGQASSRCMWNSSSRKLVVVLVGEPPASGQPSATQVAAGWLPCGKSPRRVPEA